MNKYMQKQIFERASRWLFAWKVAVVSCLYSNNLDIHVKSGEDICKKAHKNCELVFFSFLAPRIKIQICILKNLYFNDLRLGRGGKRNEYIEFEYTVCILHIQLIRSDYDFCAFFFSFSVLHNASVVSIWSWQAT